eukprot:12513-Chlamydomonas_euryale.AAC.1
MHSSSASGCADRSLCRGAGDGGRTHPSAVLLSCAVHASLLCRQTAARRSAAWAPGRPALGRRRRHRRAV